MPGQQILTYMRRFQATAQTPGTGILQKKNTWVFDIICRLHQGTLQNAEQINFGRIWPAVGTTGQELSCGSRAPCGSVNPFVFSGC